MKKMVLCITLLCCAILCSCNKTNTNNLNKKVEKFIEKVNKSESYVYYNKTKVLLYENEEYAKNVYTLEVVMNVDNVDKIFSMDVKKEDKGNSYSSYFEYIEKNNNLYYGSKLQMPILSNPVTLDLLEYHTTVDEFCASLEEDYRLNIDARTNVYDLENEMTIVTDKYTVKYNLEDYCKEFKDKNIEKYIEQIPNISTDAYVIVEYIFNDNEMTIKHDFDFDGIDNNTKIGSNIYLETTYEITSVEIEKYNKDTIRLSLKDLDSNKIIDASGFNQVFINVDSRYYGYFKIYLDAGKYNLSINKLNFNIDTSYFSYNIYDSNKNQIKESDVYNLESGYYYIYVTSQNRFPIVINKLD